MTRILCSTTLAWHTTAIFQSIKLSMPNSSQFYIVSRLIYRNLLLFVLAYFPLSGMTCLVNEGCLYDFIPCWIL